MPRESVNPTIHSQLAIASDGESPGYVPMPTVEVGWHRELGEVQIGLETPTMMVGGPGSTGQHHLVDHLYASNQAAIGAQLWQWLQSDEGKETMALPDDGPAAEDDPALVALGRAVLDAVTGARQAEGYPGDRAHTGWYTHLNREGCNRLIRLVRKARDAAFGADA